MMPDLDLCLTAQKLQILHCGTLQESCGSVFFKFNVQCNNFFTKHDILLIIYHFILNATEEALTYELHPGYVPCLFSLLGFYLRTLYKSLFILEMASCKEPDNVSMQYMFN